MSMIDMSWKQAALLALIGAPILAWGLMAAIEHPDQAAWGVVIAFAALAMMPGAIKVWEWLG